MNLSTIFAKQARMKSYLRKNNIEVLKQTREDEVNNMFAIAIKDKNIEEQITSFETFKALFDAHLQLHKVNSLEELKKTSSRVEKDVLTVNNYFNENTI